MDNNYKLVECLADVISIDSYSLYSVLYQSINNGEELSLRRTRPTFRAHTNKKCSCHPTVICPLHLHPI